MHTRRRASRDNQTHNHRHICAFLNCWTVTFQQDKVAPVPIVLSTAVCCLQVCVCACVCVHMHAVYIYRYRPQSYGTVEPARTIYNSSVNVSSSNLQWDVHPSITKMLTTRWNGLVSNPPHKIIGDHTCRWTSWHGI